VVVPAVLFAHVPSPVPRAAALDANDVVTHGPSLVGPAGAPRGSAISCAYASHPKN
jgi:hypothetical protein